MAVPETLPLPLESEAFQTDAWGIRRSGRAQRLSARVYPDGRVEIVVPQRTSDLSVRRFVERHRHWIMQRVAALQPTVAESFPPSRLELSALAECWSLHLAGGTGALRAQVQGHGLLVLRGEGGRAEQIAGLRDWLSDHVRHRYEQRLHELARQHDLQFRSLQVRRQRTRWGSCSSRGVISLNVCAVFQRPAVLDYLMLHELVHTREMNHSPAYWQRVAQCCPDWQTLDRELARGWARVPRWLFER